jgi:hypothetical protein
MEVNEQKMRGFVISPFQEIINEDRADQIEDDTGRPQEDQQGVDGKFHYISPQ